MTTFTIEFDVPDNMAAEILEDITDHLHYNPDAVPPVTRQEHLRLEVRKWLKSIYKIRKVRKARDAAMTAEESIVDSTDFV